MAEDFRSLMAPGDGSDSLVVIDGHGENSTAPAAGRKQLFVIGGMVVATVVCIFALSRGAAGPVSADAKQSVIEQQVETAVKALDAVGKDDGKAAVRGSDVAKSFYYQAAERQVPISRLKGNPFVYKPPVTKAPEPAPTAKAAEPAAGGAAPESTSVSKLTLQSVLVGTQERAAMISNNLLTRGQRINSWTLVEINTRSVVLERDGVRHVLTMAE